MSKKAKNVNTNEASVDDIDTPEWVDAEPAAATPAIAEDAADPATEHWRREVAAYEERTGEKVKVVPAWVKE